MFNIEKLSTKQQFFHNKKLFPDQSTKQIVILRHPRDTIISFCVLKEYVNSKEESIISSAVSEWIDYHTEILKNIDHLYPFFFEQTIEDPVKCLTKLSEIASIPRVDDYEAQKFFDQRIKLNRKTPTSIKMSSKLSKNYEKYEKYYESLGPDIHANLNNLYAIASEAVKTRQAKLHMVV
jgi:hypothetical protein